jgi:magnesium transporter
MMKTWLPHLDQPIGEFVRRDFAKLLESTTAREALDAVREKGLGEKIVYFYFVDESEPLVGVLPTHRLLTALPDDRIGDLMIRRVIAIPQSVTLLEACEFFVLHKFFAFPGVDGERRILGLVLARRGPSARLGMTKQELADLLAKA